MDGYWGVSYIMGIRVFHRGMENVSESDNFLFSSQLKERFLKN
jgi:hypothetical protein